MNAKRRCALIGLVATLPMSFLISIVCLAPYEPSLAQEPAFTWSEPTLLSEDPWLGWFSDIAVDNRGRVHVFWEAADFTRWEVVFEYIPVFPHGLMHRVWDGERWSELNDVIAYMGTAGIIFRLAAAADAGGYIYLTYSREGTNFSRAPTDASESAAAWSEPRKLSTSIYMSDIAVDSQGVIHIVYERTMRPVGHIVEFGETQRGFVTVVYADIFYRRSEDGGHSWSPPVNLSRSEEGGTRVQLEIDREDNIYVTWDVGWSRWGSSKASDIRHGVLIASFDGGRNWETLATVSEPENAAVQLAANSDGQGGVLAVWRARTTGDIYYMWSTDYGRSWSPGATIPGIFARRWMDNPFDIYDIGMDSAGVMHLIAVGRRTPEEQVLGLYHLAWDGSSWSAPVRISQSGWYPEYPRMAVSRGNQLHVTWFEYLEDFDGAPRTIWYSSALSAAPGEPLPPTPTPTSVPTPEPTLIPSPTATAIPDLALTPLPPGLAESIFTDTDEVLLLVKSLAPIVLIIAAVMIGQRILRKS